MHRLDLWSRERGSAGLHEIVLGGMNCTVSPNLEPVVSIGATSPQLVVGGVRAVVVEVDHVVDDLMSQLQTLFVPNIENFSQASVPCSNE